MDCAVAGCWGCGSDRATSGAGSAGTAADRAVTEAVELLRAEGYDDDFDVCAEGLCCAGEDGVHGLEGASVDQLFRFEGESDPGDEAIVLGVSCGGWGRKGIVVSAYGADVDPESAAVLLALARSAR